MRRALLLVLLAACDSLPFDPAGPDAAPDPTADGPFPVGVRTLTIEDATRPRPDGSPRRLVTEVWYPADEDARGKPGATYDFTTLLTDAQRDALSDPLPLLTTRAVRDARADADHGPYPLVVFSHGASAVRWQSTYFTVRLASHGFVVAAPDHQGNTLADALRGALDPFLSGFTDRPADVSQVIDAVGAQFSADLERVGVAGHSYGGFTALRVAALDARVKAIVPQAPPSAAIAWLDQPQPFTLAIPVMLQAAHGDQTIKWDDAIAPTWNLLVRPRYLLDLPRAGHFTFSDLCAFDVAKLAPFVNLPGVDVSNVLGDGCGAEAPPAAVAQPLINHFAIAFLNGHLRQSPGSLARLTQQSAERIAPGQATLTPDP